MYKSGPLISICLEYLGRPGNNPNVLAPAGNPGLPDRERLRLQRFISGIQVETTPADGGRSRVRVVKKLSTAGANASVFTLRQGGTMTVAQYFQSANNRPLKYPSVICVEVSSNLVSQ